MKEENKIKSKKSKKILTATTPIVMFSIGGRIISEIIENTEDKTEENTVGYDNIGTNYNFHVHKNNFVVLHVNRSFSYDMNAMKTKIEKCNEKGISIGLVLDTKAETLADIYQDIDFIQSIIKEYKIDFPIYCNINNIMSNKKLDVSQKRTLLDAFLTKTNKSDMYIGLYGNDTYLDECNKYIIDTTQYDCYLVQDSETISYTGPYSIIQNLEGKISSNNDISKTITNKKLNQANKILASEIYEVKEGDTFHSLSLRCGLSENDLIRYNSKTTLEVGDKIAIPNLYSVIDKEKKEVLYEYSIATGIDISNYNVNIDWDRVQETSEYVIIAVSNEMPNYGVNETMFLESCLKQIPEAIKHNIDVGYYFVIEKDMKVSVYEERIESHLNRLDNDLNVKINKKCIPVFLDVESYYEFNDYYQLMTVFEKKCKEHGYEQIGIYGNQSTLELISKNMEAKAGVTLKDTEWFVWLAGGEQYSSREHTNKDDVTLSDLKSQPKINNDFFETDIRQVTNVCTDTGAPDGRGHTDVSYLYNTKLFSKTFASTESSDFLELDLSKYKGIPISMILSGIEFGIGILFVIVSTKVIGTKLIVEIKNKVKEKKLNKQL